MALSRATRPNIPSEITDNGSNALRAVIFALENIVTTINHIVDYINKMEVEWKNP